MSENLVNESGLENYKKKRKKRIIVLLAVFFVLAIGYAYLQATQTIIGITSVKRNTWNVYWNSQTLRYNYSPGTTITDDPSVSDPTTVDFNIVLGKPGDYLEIIVDAKNAGTLDAMISSFPLLIDNSETHPSYIDFTASYNDGTSIAQNQILRAGFSETYKIRIAYKEDINANQLVTGSPVSLNASFTVNYVQADGNAINARDYWYTTSDEIFTFGQAVPNNASVYNNYRSAIDEVQNPIFIRYELKNGVIYSAAIGVEKSDGTLEFLPYGNEYYSANSEALLSLLGSDHCGTGTEDGGVFTTCVVQSESTNEWTAELISIPADYYHVIAILKGGTRVQDEDSEHLVGGYACAICNEKFTCNTIDDIDESFCSNE